MVRRPFTTLAVLALLGVALLDPRPAPRLAPPSTDRTLGAAFQPASPVPPSLGAPFPAGVTLTILATDLLDSPPPSPTAVRLERMTIPAGAGENIVAAGPQLLAIESGAIDLRGVPGREGTYGAGTQVVVPAGAGHVLRNEGAETAAVLRLLLDPAGATLPAAATPATDRPPSPTAASHRVLLSTTLRVPRGPTNVVLARLTWEPGVDAGPRVYPGPVGIAVESGTLTVSGPDGTPSQLGPGGSLVAPAYSAFHARNAGTAPVVGLVFGLLPADPPLAGGPLPTATPEIQATAGAQATAAAATIAALEGGRRLTEAELATARAAATVARATSDAAAARATTTLGQHQLTATAVAAELAGERAAAAALNAELGEVRATTAAVALDAVALTTDLATAGARLVAAEATLASYEAALANAETARQTEATTVAAERAAATDAAGAGLAREAALAATAQAQATAAAATATEQARRDAAIRATTGADLAVVAAQATAAQATVAALATAHAEAEERASVGINREFVELSIDTDLFGVLGGNQQAQADAVAELRRVLEPYARADCRAGVVLTFGHAGDVGTGVDFASEINAILEEELPDIFADAGFESLANITPPNGQVDIRIYFVAGCAPAEVQIGPAAPTIAPS